jgi:hypothetical protein
LRQVIDTPCVSVFSDWLSGMDKRGRAILCSRF